MLYYVGGYRAKTILKICFASQEPKKKFSEKFSVLSTRQKTKTDDNKKAKRPPIWVYHSKMPKHLSLRKGLFLGSQKINFLSDLLVNQGPDQLCNTHKLSPLDFQFDA